MSRIVDHHWSLSPESLWTAQDVAFSRIIGTLSEGELEAHTKSRITWPQECRLELARREELDR